MGRIDTLLNKWASRKLMVFFIATLLISFSKIESTDWTYIAIAYIVVQGLTDAKSIIDKFTKQI
jgi:hypothetical protein